jgi:two-component system sensor histidine kinase PilS (NtrC family)
LRYAQSLKLSSLGRLAASIAHEIRNPLGAISHATQLLQESPDIAAQDRHMLDMVLTNSAARERHRRERAADIAARTAEQSVLEM